MVLRGLKSSGRGTGDTVMVNLSWLIGVTREEEGSPQQHSRGMKVSTGEVSPMLG